MARNSVPLRPRAPSLPLGISTRLPKWRRLGSCFPAPPSLGYPEDLTLQGDGREENPGAEQRLRRRLGNLQSPASERSAPGSRQRGLSAARLAQVPHSSPRTPRPSR
ncbi:hypothetical protein NN561_015688 [Cricetulus griseus]